MPIGPDTKDWTWVLEHTCPECGFAAREVKMGDLPDLFVGNAAVWDSFLRDRLAADPGGLANDPGGLAHRPSDDVWSTLEYACHVRDVYRLACTRVTRMLEEDDPAFDNWDQDVTAVEERYLEQDPDVVRAAIVEDAGRLARLYTSVSPAAALRTGLRSDGARFTVDSFGCYLLHDPVHHLVDVGARPAAE